MVTLGVRGGRPVRWQLVRGVGFTVGLLVGLGLAAYSYAWLRDSDGLNEMGVARRLAVAATWVGIVAVLVFAWRRLRRWSERPWWLVPAAAVIAVAGLVPAVVMQVPVRPADIGHCIPVADAWRPVMAPPTAADVAYLAAHPKPQHPPLKSMTRAQLHAFAGTFNAWLSTPAQRHVEAYQMWQYGAGGCAAPSRTRLGWSGLGMGASALVLSVAVRRRRSAVEAPPAP